VVLLDADSFASGVSGVDFLQDMETF